MPSGQHPGALMLDEIHQQAAIAQSWAESGGYRVAAIADAVAAYEPASVSLIARGTSDNAAAYAKYLLEIMGGYVVSSVSPSTMTLYGARPRASRSICIAVSQSGRSPDLVRSLAAYREAGNLAIVLTNDPSSPLAAVADHVIDLAAGTEQAVAATKTFTCELLALLDLATAICGVQPPDRARIAEAITAHAAPTQALEPLENALVPLASALVPLASALVPLASALDLAASVLSTSMSRAGHLLVVSRGASTPIAHEGALKIMETVGMPALSYSAADLEHGPIAFVRTGTPVIVLDSIGPAADSLAGLIQRLLDLGAEIVQIGSAEPIADVRAHIPVHRLDPLAAPVAEAVPLQLLAHRLAIASGNDPDKPRGLAKVTMTR